MMLFFEIFVAAIISGLLQLVSHLAVVMYFPKLSDVPRYVIGTVCLILPATVLLALWGETDAMLLVWSCITSSGLAVMGARAIGGKLTDIRNQLDERERLKAFIDAKTAEED